MVLVSLTAFFILGVGLLVYKYIYPKRNISLFVLLILLSLLPLISILRPGTYESGDLSLNVYKAISFYDSLLEGNILPRWSGELNATYGYPQFIFIYLLPYYVISLFHFVGFSFIASVKLVIAVSFILSGVFMYLWTKEELGKRAAFVAAIFYLYAPYHLVDTHFRISIGEIISFALIPLILFATKKYITVQKLHWFLLMILGIFLQVLSNQAISLVGFPFIFAYIIFLLYQNKKVQTQILFKIILAFVIGLLLSMFYWLPAIIESVYTHQAFYTKTISFVQFNELIYSPWRYGLLFQGPKGELSFLIGYVQLIIIGLSFYYILRKNSQHAEKRYLLFFSIAIILFCFLMIPLSMSIWDNIALLRNFQFTSRLLFFVAICTAFLAGILSKKLNNKVLIVICILVMLQTILNWGNRRNIPSINDTVLRNNIYITNVGEGFQPAAPKWVDPETTWQYKVPKSHIEILAGQATIVELERVSHHHEYIINVTSSATFKENTLYFPNWTVYANNNTIPISYTTPKYPGIITFSLKKGLYKIDVTFQETPIRRVSSFVSAITLVVFVIFLLVMINQQTRYKNQKRRNKH
jgi:hypothetical protein